MAHGGGETSLLGRKGAKGREYVRSVLQGLPESNDVQRYLAGILRDGRNVVLKRFCQTPSHRIIWESEARRQDYALQIRLRKCKAALLRRRTVPLRL